MLHTLCGDAMADRMLCISVWFSVMLAAGLLTFKYLV